jgi:Ca-activated chloride channel family protein
MNFANPSALLLLPAIMLISTFGYFHAKSLQKRLGEWIRPEFWKLVIPDFSIAVFNRKHLFLVPGLLFLALASARPQWGEREELVETRGMDILFLLDLSNSMLAEDTPPSRLNRARTFIRNTLGNLGDDRAGIVSFAGKAFLTVPLTNDFDYVTEMAESLDPSSMSSQGTRIGEAIDVAIRAFERAAEDTRKNSRAVILISDGEDFGEHAIRAAARLKDFGAGFFTLSVGTAEGAPIPLRDERGVLQTYKKDSSQKPVISKVNRPLLARLAEAGGGMHLELINPDDAAYRVAKYIRGLSRDEQKKRMEVIRIDRFQIFLLIGVIFLVLHLFTGYRKAVFRRSAAAILFFLLPGTSNADSPYSYWQSRRGLDQYTDKKYEESANSYKKALEEDPGNPLLFFNQGTALGQSENKDEAVSNLQEATKRALSRGDFETAAKSLYNEGILHQKNQASKESFDRLTKAIELAKRSGLAEVEEKARKALAASFDQHQKQPKKQENKQEQDQKSAGNNNQKPESGSPGGPEEENGKQRKFTGKTLSRDVAESLMNDLADREKQLIQKKLGGRRQKEVADEKDW